MTYKEARVYLDEMSKYGSVLGLDTIRGLLRELGNPQDDLKFIHIAGTNGKGSVLAYTSTILSEAAAARDKQAGAHPFPVGNITIFDGCVVHGSSPVGHPHILSVVMGPTTEEEKKYFTAVLRGTLNLGAARFLHGCTGVNLDILARQPLWEMGEDFKHGTGHGVGYLLNVHEGPNSFRWKIVPGGNAVLEEGMITSDEPGYYREDGFGIRHENLMVCKKAEKTECTESGGNFHQNTQKAPSSACGPLKGAFCLDIALV